MPILREVVQQIPDDLGPFGTAEKNDFEHAERRYDVEKLNSVRLHFRLKALLFVGCDSPFIKGNVSRAMLMTSSAH
jgi:hypothetical protein